MRIEQVWLDHFGKFRDKQLKFGEGIHVIYGPNESGKSTIHGFIQAMLFGAERLRGRGAGRDAYTRYLPWNGSSRYEGRMTISRQDRRWRIIRDFSRDSADLSLIDLSNNKDLAAAGKDVTDICPELTEGNYRNTISIGQLSLMPEARFAGELQSYMANISMTGSESVNVDRALDSLKKEKKRISAALPGQELEAAKDKAEQLRDVLARGEQVEEQLQDLQDRKALADEKIRSLMDKAERGARSGREEKARAIALIQQNNDIAKRYKEKKAQLQKLRQMQNSGSAAAVNRDISRCEDDSSQRDQLLARKEGLEETGGDLLKGLALALPFLAAAVLVWLSGSSIGLSGRSGMVTALILAAAAVLMLVVNLSSGSRRRRKVQKIEGQIQDIEADMRKIFDHYGVHSISELRRGAARAGYTDTGAAEQLKEELESIRREYDALQGPLQPYLEKYGDSITLDDDVDPAGQAALKKQKKISEDLAAGIGQLQWKLEQLDRHRRELALLEDRIRQMEKKQKEGYDDLMAADLAANTIRELTTKIHGTFGAGLNEEISDMLQEITDGSHGRMTMDKNFNILVDDGRRPVSPQQLSAGTCDLIYFAVRMSISRMIFHEKMPLILDDSFALFDDDRLRRTLLWLSARQEPSQIILFTCHHREARILTQEGIPFTLHELQ